MNDSILKTNMAMEAESSGDPAVIINIGFRKVVRSHSSFGGPASVLADGHYAKIVVCPVGEGPGALL